MWKPLKLAPWFVAAGAAWSVGFVYNVYYGGELSWLRSMYFQKVALAEEVKGSRRLLVAGGSGAHYTVNSQIIESGLGMPVLNLGLDGPVGLDVILSSTLDQVRPGDIVLLIPEYLILLDEDGFAERSVPFSVAIGKPGLAGGLGVKQFLQDFWLLGIPSLRPVIKSSVDLVTKGKLTGYYADPITDRGDPTTVNPRSGDWWELPIKEPISRHAIARIAQFRQEVEARGGTLVLSLPWVYASTDKQTVTNVRNTAAQLNQIAPLVYDRDSLNLKTNSDWFADTHYHLQPEARKIRAEELVEQLKPVIKAIENKT